MLFNEMLYYIIIILQKIFYYVIILLLKNCVISYYCFASTYNENDTLK